MKASQLVAGQLFTQDCNPANTFRVIDTSRGKTKIELVSGPLVAELAARGRSNQAFGAIPSNYNVTVVTK